MFRHIVLFKVKKKADVDFVVDRLRSMEGQIPELKELEVGKNEIAADRNFDVILITGFEDEAAMDRYQVSQYHQNEVLAKIKPLIDRSVAGDYNL